MQHNKVLCNIELLELSEEFRVVGKILRFKGQSSRSCDDCKYKLVIEKSIMECNPTASRISCFSIRPSFERKSIAYA